MTANPARNYRRNNPYLTDQLSATFHRSAAGVIWRWRTETTTIAAVSYTVIRLAAITSYWWSAAIIGGSIAALLIAPPTRRLIAWRCWCLLARHRIHRLCWETRLHTRTGRIPLVIWIRPTKVGERAKVLCRAGICAEDFEAHIGELRAACWARDARVTRHPRWSQLVTIDIIHRDTLAASRHIRSPLTGHARSVHHSGHDDRESAAAVRPLSGPLNGHQLRRSS